MSPQKTFQHLLCTVPLASATSEGAQAPPPQKNKTSSFIYVWTPISPKIGLIRLSSGCSRHILSRSCEAASVSLGRQPSINCDSGCVFRIRILVEKLSFPLTYTNSLPFYPHPFRPFFNGFCFTRFLPSAF